jgi:hypothetical protein
LPIQPSAPKHSVAEARNAAVRKAQVFRQGVVDAISQTPGFDRDVPERGRV